MTKRAVVPVTGDILMGYFTEAINALVVAETAKSRAQEAEAQIQSQLATAPAHNQLYITPADLGNDVMDSLAKQSLDAHLKNVQSSQLAVASEERMQDLQLAAEQHFLGKKVRVSTAKAKSKAITPIFTHSQSGQQRLGQKHPQFIAGKVQEIQLNNNLMIVRSPLAKRWFMPQLTAYVINPLELSTLEPAVTISI